MALSALEIQYIEENPFCGYGNLLDSHVKDFVEPWSGEGPMGFGSLYSYILQVFHFDIQNTTLGVVFSTNNGHMTFDFDEYINDC